MDTKSSGELLGLLLCLLLSALFSAADVAYRSVNHSRLKELAQAKRAHAQQAMDLKRNLDRVLLALLVCDTAANAAGACLCTLLFRPALPRWGGLAAALTSIACVLLLGELLPKVLAKCWDERYALWSAPWLRFVSRLFTPLQWLAQKLQAHFAQKSTDEGKLAQDELMDIVDEAQNVGGIDARNGELIRSAISFNELDASDILTPRVDVVAVERSDTLEEITSVFLANHYSRLPVYEESLDNIVGMIHEKDFFRGLHTGLRSIEALVKKVIYVGTGIPVIDLLHELQQSQTHMAVVVDEFGGTEGIVTMEDIVEELVGEIWDEHDQKIEYFRRIGEGRYAVDCSADLDDFFAFFHLGLDAEDFDYVTVSGWVMEQLGKVPSAGDSFTYKDMRVTVTSATARHAVQVVLQLHPGAKQKGANSIG